MNTTGRRIIQKVLAILIILTLTLADLTMVGVNLVSYAIDLAQTDNENVGFLAYFENNTSETTATVDEKDLKLHFEISVKKDGYLSNAKLELAEGANFKFKKDLDNSYITKIDEKAIYLKQINEGETAKVEVPIEFLDCENCDMDYLNKVSTVNLHGTYKNSKNIENNRNIEVKGKADLKVNWKSSDKSKSILKAELLTNYTYNVEAKNKHIVQVLVSSNMYNNSYPVKTTNIELNLSNLVKNVAVHKRTTDATNANRGFEYNYEDGKLTINVQNGKENKISWLKNVEDIFVVTMEYPEMDAENTQITDDLHKISVKSTLTTYDEKIFTQNAEVIVSEDKDCIVSANQLQDETTIPKGKIYSGEERHYTHTSQVYIDYSKLVEAITIEEKKPQFLIKQEKKDTNYSDTISDKREANIEYKQTLINKAEFTSIFGEDGSIEVKNQNDETIATITKENQTDENGNIKIEYSQGTSAIKFITSSPITDGILNLKHENVIMNTKYSREEIKELIKIFNESEITYKKYGDNNNKVLYNASSEINLKETESKAKLSVDSSTLGVSENKQDINMTVFLESDNEENDLFKNPELKITLPKQINSISAQARVINGNDKGLSLTQDNFKVKQENGQFVINMKLTGEQKEYATNGTSVQIVAKVGLNRLSTNSKEEIKLNYTNENATKYADNGEEKVQINVISENSMILTNNINEYNVTTFGKENDKEISLPVNAKLQNATVRMQIVNNEGTDLSNVSILGKIANETGKIDRTSAIRTNVDSAKVYYTDVENPTTDVNKLENAWKEQNIKNAKNYLVVIGTMKKAQQINISYDITVAENLQYNTTAESNYTVYYTNPNTEKQKEVASTKLILTTGKVAELKLDMTADVGGVELKEGDTVKAGEIITYTAKVTNTGKQNAENVTIEAIIPQNGTLLELNPKYTDKTIDGDVDRDPEPYLIEKADKTINKVISIGAEKTEEYKFMIKVNSNVQSNENIETNLSVKYQNKELLNKKMLNKVGASAISVKIKPIYREANTVLKVGYNYQYMIEIENLTDTELKNVNVSIKNSELMEIKNITYTSGDIHNSQFNSPNFTIESIAAKNKAIVEIDISIKQGIDDTKLSDISVIVTDSNKNEYRSNVVSDRIEKMNIVAELTSNKDGYLKLGEEIKYTIKVKNNGKEALDKLIVKDQFSDYLELKSITLNGKACEYSEEYNFDKDSNYSYLNIDAPLAVGQENIIEIVGSVIENLQPNDVLKVINKAFLYNGILLTQTEEKMAYIEKTADDDGEIENEDLLDVNPDDIDSDVESADNKYTISGRAWLDSNHNGSRDTDEELLEGIKVYVIDVSNNKILTNKTGDEISDITKSDGFYTLNNIPKGNYIVGFEYDNEKYMVTLYQADGVDEDNNSDAVKASKIINGEERTLAFTDSIELDESKANIDLGLFESKVFDLQLEKVISKIIITNKEGTKTYNFDNANIAKVEIAAKNLNNSNVVIEYKMKIKNNGEIAGYAKSIVDYMPSSFTFNSSLNSDWYQKGKNLYNDSLADTKIEPGEEKEITLTLTKKMTESNTGLTNNKAEIESSYNSLGIPNKSKTIKDTEQEGESTADKRSADAIIGVKTGVAQSFIALTLIIIIAICGIAYLINKKVLAEKIEKGRMI